MPSYIAESCLPRTRCGDLSLLATRARDAARTLAEEGQDVTYLRSGRLGFAALLASGALAAASQALAAGDPECGSGGSSFTAASGVTYACNGAPGAEGTQGPAGAQGLKGDATAGPFATGIVPTGTAFDGTNTWVVTSPNSGVIELNPDGTFPGRGQAARDRVRRHPHVGVLA